VESRSVRIHERRTPITLIAGHAEGLLRRGPPTPTACSSASPPWWTTPLLYSDGPVTLAASTGPAGELVLHVIDRGPGVAIEEREAIFGRFVRGTAGLASPHRGSGIGLSVVRLLIEAMGGRVQVAAQHGGGADFQLLLPGVAGDRVAG
jgi:signal transduction histidine kinase